jgi:hypothetical protein
VSSRSRQSRSTPQSRQTHGRLLKVADLEVELMEGFEHVERIDLLETLTAAQHELLDEAIRQHQELVRNPRRVQAQQRKSARCTTQRRDLGWRSTCLYGRVDGDVLHGIHRPGVISRRGVVSAAAVADAAPWLEDPSSFELSGWFGASHPPGHWWAKVGQKSWPPDFP